MSPDLDLMRRQRNVRKAAEYRKRRALAELRGEPFGPIPAAPIRTKIKALTELGWSSPAIIAAAGIDVTPAGLHYVAKGTGRSCGRPFAPIADLPVTLAVPDSVPDECHIPMLGATRRIRALMALGWRHEDISDMIGGRASHHISAGKFKQMAAMDWRLVALAFEKLSAVPGPSEMSRQRAAQQGFAVPLAYDDIDDPNEQPEAVRICAHDGCAEEVKWSGLCLPHYNKGARAKAKRLRIEAAS